MDGEGGRWVEYRCSECDVEVDLWVRWDEDLPEAAICDPCHGETSTGDDD